MNREKLTEKKDIFLLFILCFMVYYATYLGRLNYSAALAEIVRAEGFAKGQAGLIGTAFFCAYGIGQLFSGFIGDRLNGKWLVFTGLAVSGWMNGMMSCLHTVQGMSIVWCVNGMAQSFVWSPMLRIICELLDDERRIKFCLYINYSVPLGTVSSYGLSALMLERCGWRGAFAVPAVVVVGVALLWLVGLKKISGKAATVENRKRRKTEEPEETSQSQQNVSLKGLVLQSGILFLLVSLFMQGALKDGVTTWIPTYLSENYQMGTVNALLGTMVIPLCNLIGVSLASLADRHIGRNEVLTASLFFGVCGCALSVLLCWKGCGAVTALLLLAMATTSMTAVNTMLVAVLPSRFGRIGKASTMSGILNSAVYAGCAVSTYGIGALSESWGWDRTILLWLSGAVLAGGICLALHKKWKEYADTLMR